jgi:hypothetical protein
MGSIAVSITTKHIPGRLQFPAKAGHSNSDTAEAAMCVGRPEHTATFHYHLLCKYRQT